MAQTSSLPSGKAFPELSQHLSLVSLHSELEVARSVLVLTSLLGLQLSAIWWAHLDSSQRSAFLIVPSMAHVIGPQGGSMTNEEMLSSAFLWPMVSLACPFFKGTIQETIPPVLTFRETHKETLLYAQWKLDSEHDLTFYIMVCYRAICNPGEKLKSKPYSPIIM